jgi:hypothetical protein
LTKLYKAHVLPVLEAQTASVYHASPTVLDNLDRVQRLFLRESGLDDETALLHHNLAPLNARRDMAMLGLLHKCALGEAPPQLLGLFPLAPPAQHHPNTRLHARRHHLQLEDKAHGNHTGVLHRSLFGLVAVYNLLPPWVVSGTVKTLQTSLQYMLKRLTQQPNWQHSLNRTSLLSLQVRRLYTDIDSWRLPPRPRRNRASPAQRRRRRP